MHCLNWVSSVRLCGSERYNYKTLYKIIVTVAECDRAIGRHAILVLYGLVPARWWYHFIWLMSLQHRVHAKRSVWHYIMKFHVYGDKRWRKVDLIGYQEGSQFQIPDKAVHSHAYTQFAQTDTHAHYHGKYHYTFTTTMHCYCQHCNCRCHARRLHTAV